MPANKKPKAKKAGKPKSLLSVQTVTRKELKFPCELNDIGASFVKTGAICHTDNTSIIITVNCSTVRIHMLQLKKMLESALAGGFKTLDNINLDHIGVFDALNGSRLDMADIEFGINAELQDDENVFNEECLITIEEAKDASTTFGIHNYEDTKNYMLRITTDIIKDLIKHL